MLVTSPGSPDCMLAKGSVSRYSNRLTPSGVAPMSGEIAIQGRIQVKLGFETSTFRLIVTIICAAGLAFRSNGASRNPYVKVSFEGLPLGTWL